MWTVRFYLSQIWEKTGFRFGTQEKFIQDFRVTMIGGRQLAAREKYFFVIAQNTNPVNILRILDEVCKRCPVDTEKIYLAGFSQGANQCHSLYTHYPDRVTAAALTCMDIWRPWDNMDERYTEEELETLKEKTVPLSLQAGMCEPFPYVPLNSWRKNKMNPIPPEMRGSPDDFIHPGKIAANDPTRITTPGKGRIDPFCPGAPRMTSAYIPGADEDVHRWSIERVNKRLELLNCEPLEVEKCISFLNNKENQIRHITGIYGDEEEILNLLEIRHYAVKIKDRQKRTVFQYIATENSPHWPPVTTAELGWDFLKQFRRDTHSGWIVWKEKERNESGNETSKESNHF